ncbi:hypothetical protein GCM10009799_39440 [Nocardiopsis rhodophaea]|uniref:ATP-binding protein n=1 Tax=Nocardiopsis rhodophaea TaxID=280238 RepID=A0ABP5EXX5_9ACTN
MCNRCSNWANMTSLPPIMRRSAASSTLVAERSLDGIKLTCRDHGQAHGRGSARDYLRIDPAGFDTGSETGRGLVLIDAFATTWGDSGWVSHRHVWFYLAYDLRDSAWNIA